LGNGGNSASADGIGGDPSGSNPRVATGMPGGSSFAGVQLQKHRFCASYPHVGQCRRGAACAFAHTREEATTPLFEENEEQHSPEAMTEQFFTEKFKTLWCPIGAQHDWQNCPYAHTYQDARRKPSIGYGPQPCPYWSKKDTRVAYAQRCPLGLRCPYSHGAKEQLYHPKYFRTVICRDLQLKGCPRQTLCAFFHRRQERRQAEADHVDYTQPLEKDNLTHDWSTYFLSPPFFQEGADEGGQPTGMPTQGMGMGSQGMGGKGGMPYGPGMMPQSGCMMGPGSTWYAGYLAGISQHGPQGGGFEMPESRMPESRIEGGSRTPTTAESDGGLEEVDELESTQELMGMMHPDAMSWNGGFHPGFVRVPVGGPQGPMGWGGMPFYGQGGGSFRPPYGVGYPYYNSPMDSQTLSPWETDARGPGDMPDDTWWGGPQ
jgi:hypothetical protein